MRSIRGLAELTGRVAVLGTSLVAVMLWHDQLPAQSRPPNIVIILADDLGYAELGCQGCKDIPTPHIDSLANNGIRCTDGYVSSPYCSPSRAGRTAWQYIQDLAGRPHYLLDTDDQPIRELL